MTDIRDERTFF